MRKRQFLFIKKGYFLVFLTSVISGFAIFINKFGVKVVNPDIYTFLKVLITTIFLTGLLLFLKDWHTLKSLNRKQWFLLTAIGFSGGSIPFLLFFRGLSLSNAAQSSFIHKTMFVWTAISAALFLKEKIDKKFFIGGSLLLLGSFILLKKPPHFLNQGDLLVFLATLLWAAENTISKYALRDLEARFVAWGRMFFGALFILMFLLATNQLHLISSLTLEQFRWILVTAIILFGYVTTWYHGLKLIPVSKATAILLLGSPITTLLSFIQTKQIDSERIFSSIFIALGLLLILGLKKILPLFKRLKRLVYGWP